METPITPVAILLPSAPLRLSRAPLSVKALVPGPEHPLYAPRLSLPLSRASPALLQYAEERKQPVLEVSARVPRTVDRGGPF